MTIRIIIPKSADGDFNSVKARLREVSGGFANKRKN